MEKTADTLATQEEIVTLLRERAAHAGLRNQRRRRNIPETQFNQNESDDIQRLRLLLAENAELKSAIRELTRCNTELRQLLAADLTPKGTSGTMERHGAQGSWAARDFRDSE
jgi:hypothetical protein